MSSPALTNTRPGAPVRGHATVGDRVTRDSPSARRQRIWRVMDVRPDGFLVMNSAGVCSLVALTGGWRFAG